MAIRKLNGSGREDKTAEDGTANSLMVMAAPGDGDAMGEKGGRKATRQI
jgi:hypothetical protein